MRLVYRDKGCVVCHAEGIDSVYQYHDDSRFFGGSHIFPFAWRQADSGMFILKSSWSIQLNVILLKWTLRGYQNLGPVYCNKRRECYPQQARSSEN